MDTEVTYMETSGCQHIDIFTSVMKCVSNKIHTIV